MSELLKLALDCGNVDEFNHAEKTAQLRWLARQMGRLRTPIQAPKTFSTRAYKPPRSITGESAFPHIRASHRLGREGVSPKELLREGPEAAAKKVREMAPRLGVSEDVLLETVRRGARGRAQRGAITSLEGLLTQPLSRRPGITQEALSEPARYMSEQAAAAAPFLAPRAARNVADRLSATMPSAEPVSQVLRARAGGGRGATFDTPPIPPAPRAAPGAPSAGAADRFAEAEARAAREAAEETMGEARRRASEATGATAKVTEKKPAAGTLRRWLLPVGVGGLGAYLYGSAKAEEEARRRLEQMLLSGGYVSPYGAEYAPY